MRRFEFKRNRTVISVFLLVRNKECKTQHLVEEISLFYFPGDNRFVVMWLLHLLLLRSDKSQIHLHVAVVDFAPTFR